MDRSYRYSRRQVSRARLHKCIAAVAAAGLLGATAVFMLTWKSDPISASAPSAVLPLLAFKDPLPNVEPGQGGVRRIYPYSVVPGGVSGQTELKRVIRTDSVVAAHYATFDADKARAVVVDKPRAVHVSYRKGDKVYWTARKVMLEPGETLLSDGKNEMRARCANRISDVPQYPVEAHQPAMEELDQAVELADGEQYALGPDGLPVSMAGEGGIGRHTGVRFPARGAGGGVAGSGSTPTDASTLSTSATDAGPIRTLGLSGSSSSMGSRPVPTSRPVASRPATSPGTPIESGSGSSSPSGSPAPSGGSTSPAPQPGTDSETPVATPLPDTSTPLPTTEPTPPSGSPSTGPLPAPPIPAPGPGPAPAPTTETPPRGEQSGGGTSGELPPPPSGPAPLPPPSGPAPLPPPSGPVTEPFIPKPDLGPTPQPGTEQPVPAEVPEPGSLSLFGAAAAAMLVLRRRRRA